MDSKTQNYGAQHCVRVKVENGKQITEQVVWEWAGGDGVWRVTDERKAPNA